MGTVLLMVLMAHDVAARERLIRPLDERHGLPVSTVFALEQDSTGFVWIGTPGGLHRYDGRELRAWARDAIPAAVVWVRSAPDGGIYVVDLAGGLHRIVGDETTVIADDDGPIRDVHDVLPTPEGTLVVVAAGAVRIRDGEGTWSAPIAGLGEVHRVQRGRDGTLWAATRDAVWRLLPDGPPVLVAEQRGIVDLLPASDGSLRLSVFTGGMARILAVDGDATTELLRHPMRPIALAWRDDVLWASFDAALAALRPGQAPEVLQRDEGVRTGGPLLVDREGSLWLGTFQGLLQFPEPETWFWSDRDGLPRGPRFLARSHEGMWVAAWNGLGFIDPDTGTASRETTFGIGHGLCVDGRGRVWGANAEGLLERSNMRWTRHDLPPPHRAVPEGCATAPDGSVWLSADDLVHHVPLDGPRQAFAPPSFDPSSALTYMHVFALYEDRKHRIWAGIGDRACWADARRPITADRWTCLPVPGSLLVRRFSETESGHLWAATDENGVARFDEATQTWTPIPGSLRQASRKVMGIVPSRRGGTWILGYGFLVRVLDRPELPDGWEVVESLGAWHGLHSNEAEDLVEDPDGTLWITQNPGVGRIPPAVRDREPEPPPVALIELRIDGVAHRADAPLLLPYRRNRLELTFAALSYRDPGRLWYRFRLQRDEAWSEPTRQPSFRLVDLAPGAYSVEVSASIDGVHWSAEPSRVEFVVERPWYLQPWAIAAFATVMLAALYGIHRVRVAFLLRLERQRARIAMDLHDEVGSALGSIGILAELASDGHVDEPKRRDLAARIAATADEVSESMSDIVWALREGSSTLDALAAYLAERGARMFPDAEPRLEVQFPAVLPAVPLSLGVCRNVQSIALEALHNASRHARAQRVVLGLAPAGARRWSLWVEDDGIGLVEERSSVGVGGVGLPSMRRRADEIRATLVIEARAHRGTRVELTFDPGAQERAIAGSHVHASDRARKS